MLEAVVVAAAAVVAAELVADVVAVELVVAAVVVAVAVEYLAEVVVHFSSSWGTSSLASLVCSCSGLLARVPGVCLSGLTCEHKTRI